VLRTVFSPYGELVYVKIPTASKGCGFVQFVTRASAEAAFALHGVYIGNHPVRLSWGKYANKAQDKEIDFTQPPDIHAWNEEYMEGREDQFLDNWQWRKNNGIYEIELEGPDASCVGEDQA